MVAASNPLSTTGPWEFDSTGLARAIVEGRRRLDWSTRDLSRRAGISQPYVVALERSRVATLCKGPTPTVEVLARLAHALRIAPDVLFNAALRSVGRHALLVVEDHRRSPLEHARQAAGGDLDTWVWAASSKASTFTDSHRSIDLRRDSTRAYQPVVIAQSLLQELRRLGSEFGAGLDGQSIGLVFADTSAVMSSLDDPYTIIAFEHRWAEVVSDAAASVGAHAAWNVCVYELAALRELSDPVAATLDLMRSHTTVWAARRDDVSTGQAGVRRILERLRPPNTTRAAWRATTEHLVDSLGLAA